MEMGAQPLHGEVAFGIVVVDEPLGLLHQFPGGIGPSLADQLLDPQAPLHAPVLQGLGGVEVRGLDGAGESGTEHLGKLQPGTAGELEKACEKLQEKEVALGHGLPRGPELVRQLPATSRTSWALPSFTAAVTARSSFSSKAGADAGVRLQVADVDGAALAHQTPVIQGAAGAGCGFGQLLRRGAGGAHAHRQLHPQVPLRKGADRPMAAMKS